jgi:hypothetical protein
VPKSISKRTKKDKYHPSVYKFTVAAAWHKFCFIFAQRLVTHSFSSALL